MSQIKSVLLWENQRRYIREAIDAGTLKGAIIPAGSTEQHNEHLAMYHDTQSAVYVSKLAAEKLFPQVIVTIGDWRIRTLDGPQGHTHASARSLWRGAIRCRR